MKNAFSCRSNEIRRPALLALYCAHVRRQRVAPNIDTFAGSRPLRMPHFDGGSRDRNIVEPAFDELQHFGSRICGGLKSGLSSSNFTALIERRQL